MTESIIEKKRELKTILLQLKQLETTIMEIFNAKETLEQNRYVSFVNIANTYSRLAVNLKNNGLIVGQYNIYSQFDYSKMNHYDIHWPTQKLLIERTLLDTRLLISLIDGNFDFVEDQLGNLENFIKATLRATFYDVPDSEKSVQNNIESLFLGKGYKKGTDFERESGKFQFSGREYIPDFILKKLNLCIEVKLLKGNKTVSKIIEEINADITAYKKEYENVLFIIYDINKIQNEEHFRNDLENIDRVKVVIVKH